MVLVTDDARVSLMSVSRGAQYSSKIIKAGALLPDTKLLLANWDLGLDVGNNLARAQEDNLFGKASRSRVRDILAIFRQRYLSNPDVLPALVCLAQAGTFREGLDRILYFLSARSDPLLCSSVLELLVPRVESYRQDVTVGDVESWLRQQVADRRTEADWSAETTTRVARGLLSTLRDFGILQGGAKKRITPVYLPTDAFAFIAFLLARQRQSGDRVLHDPAWRLFFLSDAAVERFFLEAHQEGLLEYHAAGRVIRVEFPADTPEDYAHVITQRTH
jgi:Putative inner membrane protein (DUF1819)